MKGTLKSIGVGIAAAFMVGCANQQVQQLQEQVHQVCQNHGTESQPCREAIYYANLQLMQYNAIRAQQSAILMQGGMQMMNQSMNPGFSGNGTVRCTRFFDTVTCQ